MASREELINELKKDLTKAQNRGDIQQAKRIARLLTEALRGF